MSVKREWKPSMSLSKETLEEVNNYPIVAIPSRKLTKETCEHFGVRCSLNPLDGKTIEAIYFPVYEKGVLVDYQKKDLTKAKNEDYHFTFITKKASSSSDLFGQNVAPTGGKKSYTHEGALDAMSSWQVMKEKYPTGNPACVAIMATSWAVKQVANQQSFYEKFQETVMALDQDECTPEELKKGVIKGKEATAAIAQLMPNILVASFSEKDANDMLKEGKGEELYWALVSKSKPYVPEEIKFGSDISIEEIMTPLQEGVYIDAFPKTMKMLRGFRKGEMTIILAPTKSGKSTICRELGYGILDKGGFLGNQFLEEDQKKTVQAYIALDNNVLLPAFRENPNILTREQVKASKDRLIDNNRTVFLEANKLSPETVLKNMRYMAAIGAEYIILDHLSFVLSGTHSTDERKDIDLLLHELAAFKKEANVHLIVVAHIKRKDFQPKKDKEGNILYPYWIPVSKEDGRGSAAFEQLCDNLIVIEPEVLNAEGQRGRIRIKIAAAREWDDTGISDTLIMDRETGRMVNAENKFEF